MKIIRNDLEIELTELELSKAYLERQHLDDVEDIMDILDNYINESSKPNEIEMKQRIQNDPGFADKVAYRYRKFLSCDNKVKKKLKNLIYAYNYMC